MKIIIAIFTTLLLCGQAFAASKDIFAKNLETRVVQNLLDYKQVSIRLEAMNYAEPAKVFIRYRALDFSGYELTSGTVSDTLQKYDSKYLTGTLLVKNDVYNRINKWEISQIDAYPAQ